MKLVLLFILSPQIFSFGKLMVSILINLTNMILLDFVKFKKTVRLFFLYKDTSITSTGCWPGWAAKDHHCYLAVVTTPLVRNNARAACRAWDSTGEVDLASVWYQSHWTEILHLLVCTLLFTLFELRLSYAIVSIVVIILIK